MRTRVEEEKEDEDEKANTVEPCEAKTVDSAEAAAV
jgi:hypothetical protein